MERQFITKDLYSEDSVECFCIVPCKHEGSCAEEDKAFLKNLAIIPEQTHSLDVGIVDDVTQSYPATDALITFLKETPIGVVTADCVPILLYAPDVDAVAAVHAGWKGTLGGIVDNVLDVLERHGADLSKASAVFGPSVSMEVYEVDCGLAERFTDAGFGKFVSSPSGLSGKPHVDLQGVNAERLMRRGVLQENIHLCNDCTYATDGYHSYRRDGEKAGRQLTAIVLH